LAPATVATKAREASATPAAIENLRPVIGVLLQVLEFEILTDSKTKSDPAQLALPDEAAGIGMQMPDIARWDRPCL